MTLTSTELRSLILSSRRLHQAGGGSVLDGILRLSGKTVEEIAPLLESEAGVSVLPPGLSAAPDFTMLDRKAAASLRSVPLRLAGETSVSLAVADPWDDDVVRRATSRLGAVPRLFAATSTALDSWLGTSHPQTEGQSAATAEMTVSGPVVEFVDSAIRSAYDSGASDVHFECSRSGVVVKFRQDGVLTVFSRMDDRRRAEEVISRIKVLAQLDITERRVPQDGRFRVAMADRQFDLRVSIMPSVFGEDAVLRLLDKAQTRTRDAAMSLGILGFADESAERIRDLAQLPHGMLLVTGPTGSGKTTTVYAVLSEINTGLEKIITIEDPVEYELPGVLQIPVNEKKGLTFARGLRSILRHDPDRILVGEIRDAETAEIAVQSALTGHQVFTTVHANSVFDVIGRFRHFGLDMFGFMASLNGVVVQRLVRRICPNCASTREPSERESRWLSALGRGCGSVPEANGCAACRGSGFRGRTVIAEVHSVDDAFRDLVTSAMPISSLREQVEASGVSPLSMQAAELVARSITTPEEIKRVVGWS